MLKAAGPKRLALAMEAVVADPMMSDAHAATGIAAATPETAAATFRRALDLATLDGPNARFRAVASLSLAESALGNTPAMLSRCDGWRT